MVPGKFRAVNRPDGKPHWLVPHPRCPCCFTPIEPSFDACYFCNQPNPFETSILERVVASTLYMSPGSAFPWPHTQEILALKDRGAHAVAYAAVLADVLRDEKVDLGAIDYVVPLPSTKPRQASGPLALANALAERLGKECLPTLVFARAVTTQKDLKRDARFENRRGAMDTEHTLDDAVLLLVDDVATSCATLLEAARALEANGARACVGAVAGRDTDTYALARAGLIRKV